MDRYAASHFDGHDPYRPEIERNIAFLRDAIAAADLKRLRRSCYSLSERAPSAA